MAKPNAYAGSCIECGAHVKAERGYLAKDSRGRWGAICTTCHATTPEPVAAPTVVRVAQDGPETSFRVAGRLDDGMFAAFRSALVGCRYEQGVNYLPTARAGGAVAALRAAGITLDVAPAVQGAIDAMEAEKIAAVLAADVRTEAVDAVLAARGGALYAYQREGVVWLAPRMTALVADDMGLGKTIQALTALPAGAPVIVVCPAVAKSVWQSEAAKWRSDLRVTICDGKGSFRAPAAGEIVVLNPDILSGKIGEGADGRLTIEAGSIPALLPGTCVIVDEAHVFASSKSQRTLRMRALAQTARDGGGRVWLLTATPLKNRPTELWNVLNVAGLAREAFGSWTGFLRAFGGQKNKWGGTDWGHPSPEVPAMLRRVSLRRCKVDVLADLPAKTHRTLPAEIDRATAKLCDEALTSLGGDAGIEAAAAKLEDADLGFERLSAARAALSRAKIPAMLSVVETYEEQGEPLVVFSAYRAPIDLLGSREGWATITGDTSNAKRGEIVDAFQAGKLRGVACTIRAGGVAITLTRASNVLRVDREWNPALNVQAEDRCYRIGQKSAVLVTDLVAAHPLDRMLSACIERKEALISASVDAATVTRIDRPATIAIDWSAIEAEAAQACRDAEAAQAQIAAGASERARKLAETRAQNARRNAQEKVRASAARRLNESPTEYDAPRRAAATEIEAWAIAGLRQLAEDDPDRARERNGAGFSAGDGGIGHALAWLPDLTDQEWRLAVSIAYHYERTQIGAAPGRVAA